jgi:hypothetical protein
LRKFRAAVISRNGHVTRADLLWQFQMIGRSI